MRVIVVTLLWKVMIILGLVAEGQYHTTHSHAVTLSRMELFCFWEDDLTHYAPKQE